MAHPHMQDHIDLIARHEQEFLQNRTRAERLGDAIARYVGSFGFVGLHLLLFTVWIALNTIATFARVRFDPYPFAMLDTVVAIEAILLASFILMRQDRISRRSDERDHLMLQVLLLTEKEITALLRANREMAKDAGVTAVVRDPEIRELSQPTSIDEVAENIRESLDAEE